MTIINFENTSDLFLIVGMKIAKNKMNAWRPLFLNNIISTAEMIKYIHLLFLTDFEHKDSIRRIIVRRKNPANNTSLVAVNEYTGFSGYIIKNTIINQNAYLCILNFSYKTIAV